MKFSEVPVGQPFDWKYVTYIKTTKDTACDIVGFSFNQEAIVEPTQNGLFQRLVNLIKTTNPDTPK